MRLSQFLDTQPDKQPIDVIEWNEPEPGTLAYRYPMLDMEIQTGATLAVRECEMAVFVEQGWMADVFGPGVYRLNAATLPLLSELKRWEKGFAAPFQSDVYFFSMRGEVDQRWGTSTPIVLRDKESGAIRVRGYGVYSYRIADPRTFFAQVSGRRESYFVYDLDDRLRKTIVAGLEEMLVAAGVSYAELIANAAALSGRLGEQMESAFAALGLELTQFAMQTISLQDEMQPALDQHMEVGVDDNSQAGEGATSCDCCGASMRSDNGIWKCDYCHSVVLTDAGGDGAGVLAESAGQACPACAIPLLQATIGGASLLYCTRCDGMLVAMEEFEALVRASRALADGSVAVQARDTADLQRSIACPQCRQAMRTHCYGGPGKVAIDNCESCGLNWLDHDELARIAHGPASGFEGGGNGSGAYFNPAHTDLAAGFNAGV